MPETTLDLLLRCADPACGLEFIPRTSWQKYHAPRCRKRHWERVRGRGCRETQAPALACPHCGTRLALALEPVGRFAKAEGAVLSSTAGQEA